MITVGIDPGLTGAVAFLRDGNLIAVEDIPTVLKGTGSVKQEIDASGLIRVFQKHVGPDESVDVALERVNAMPGQGTSSIFSLGDSFGCIRACVAAVRFPVIYVTPQTWKKYYKLTSDKEMSRALAVRMFPEAPINLKKHSDRAEAILMARWLYETKYS